MASTHTSSAEAVMALVDIVDFSTVALKALDTRGKTNPPYRPGIGPFGKSGWLSGIKTRIDEFVPILSRE